MRKLSDYEGIVGAKEIDEIYELAKIVKGRHIKMINSTKVGGGVAEMLHRIVPILNDLGVYTTWDVIEGYDEFFEVTKAFHNALQGKEHEFGGEELYHWTMCNLKNSMSMSFDADLVVVHDPQPAGMIAHIDRTFSGAKWIWRCHIDMSNPNKQLWKFLKPYINRYDAAIFTSEKFIPGDLSRDVHTMIFHPSIDPLDDKNKELDAEYIVDVLKKYDIPTDKPIITQVSRYDPWKDPIGVIKAFKMARDMGADARLLLIGDKAADDPESDRIFAKVKAEAGDDSDIHLLLFSPSIATEINAFQRASYMILQKSLREGFALTITEALWKERPVIAGNVGGIPIQIVDRRTGLLVDSIESAATRMTELYRYPEFATWLGTCGKVRVKENFLITKNVKRYLKLLNSGL